MWKKFKELKTLPKIIVGIIAFIFIPFTLMILAVELFIKSVKNKKIFGSIVGLILSVILIFINIIFVEVMFTPTNPEKLASMEAEQKINEEQEAKARAEAEQKHKEEQEAKEKAEAEQKRKEEQKAKEKAEAEQKRKEEQEAKEKAEAEQKQKDNEDKEFEYISIGTPSERPVMNGIKTERIGTYLDAVCNNTSLTDEELIQFYKDYVKDTDYNWVQLRFPDGTGLHFSDIFFSYCTLDIENGVSNEKGHGRILLYNNEVEYEGVDYTK